MDIEQKREYKRNWQNEWRKNNLAKSRLLGTKYSAQYRLRHPEKAKEMSFKSMKSWRERNPLKVKAHRTIFVAVRNGSIVKKPCEHCMEINWKVQAHHEDYSKPLEVKWLCKIHHRLADDHRRKLSTFIL